MQILLRLTLTTLLLNTTLLTKIKEETSFPTEQIAQPQPEPLKTEKEPNKISKKIPEPLKTEKQSEEIIIEVVTTGRGGEDEVERQSGTEEFMLQLTSHSHIHELMSINRGAIVYLDMDNVNKRLEFELCNQMKTSYEIQEDGKLKFGDFTFMRSRRSCPYGWDKLENEVKTFFEGKVFTRKDSADGKIMYLKTVVFSDRSDPPGRESFSFTFGYLGMKEI